MHEGFWIEIAQVSMLEVRSQHGWWLPCGYIESCYRLNFPVDILYIALLHGPWGHLQPGLIFVQMAWGVTRYSVESTVTSKALTFHDSIVTKPTVIMISHREIQVKINLCYNLACGIISGRRSWIHNPLHGSLSWTVCIDTQCTGTGILACSRSGCQRFSVAGPRLTTGSLVNLGWEQEDHILVEGETHRDATLPYKHSNTS